jgi:tetratricopeptide (TPR) repeat protein
MLPAATRQCDGTIDYWEKAMKTGLYALGSSLGVLLVLLSGGCKREEAAGPSGAAPGGGPAGAPGGAATELVLPEMDLGKLPPALETKIGAARREALRSPDELSKVTDLGALCYAHGLPQAAVACFQQLTRLAPQEPLSWYYLGLASERAGDTAQAEAAYEKALAVKDDFRIARTRLEALLLTKDAARAKQMFEGTLASDPNDAVAHAGLGLLALSAGQRDEAAQQFHQSLKLAPKYGPAHAGLATVLSQQGKTAEADEQRRQAAGDERLRPILDQYMTALLQRGLDLQTLLSSAMAAADRKQYTTAEQLLRDAVDVDETGVQARTDLGEVLGRQGKLDEAVTELERVLNMPEGKDYTPAKVKLAFALTLLKEYDRAEKLLREVLKEKPDDLDALRRFCAMANLEQAPDKALPVLKAALEAAPLNAELHERAAEWYLQLGKPEEARAAQRRAVELEPDSVPARYDLGVLLYQADDKAGARQQFSEALRIDPKALAPRMALHDVLVADKDYDGVERLMREGLELLPESPELANALAWYLATCPDAARRKPEEAVKWAEKACDLTKHNDDAMLDTLAAAYAAAGRFDDARKAIADAIKIAEAGNRQDYVKDYQTRQALYEAGKPFVERQ